MTEYVVTGYVKRIGRRDTLSIPMTLAKAREFKSRTDRDMKIATPKYKWVKDTKIKRITKK